MDAIGRLDEQVGELEPRLASIEKAVQNDPAARELANQVFECLPTKTELDSYQETVGAAGTQPPDEVVARRQSGKVADLANHLEVPQHRVREALERLQRDNHQVHSRERDGAMRYYKEG